MNTRRGRPPWVGWRFSLRRSPGTWSATSAPGVVFSDQTLVVVAGILAMATLGLVDDTSKIRARQNRGVYWKVKGVLSLVVSFGIATVLVVTTDIDTRVSLTCALLPGWELGPVLWVLWAGIIIFATANAVNVTDGLDGLAAGSALFGFIAFTGFAFWALRNPAIYGDVVNPYDLAVLAAAFAGACAGFDPAERGARPDLHG